METAGGQPPPTANPGARDRCTVSGHAPRLHGDQRGGRSHMLPAPGGGPL
ncbi:hypothetical protein chiPu_0028838, partial [Chiloscyllium punctatum]|nr:hypothetical protein [Chiloscyllium punctatum]